MGGADRRANRDQLRSAGSVEYGERSRRLTLVPSMQERWTGYCRAVDDARVLLHGFPMELRQDVTAVADAVARPDFVMAARGERVSVQGEEVVIPYRVYNPELSGSAIGTMSDRQRLIAGCIYSRHCDGHLRERSCARIVASAEPWVVPYVVRLLGEYVVEISALILDRLTAQSSFTSPGYRQFVRANTDFMARTEQRAVSYWNCYYRQDHARAEYPAIVAISRLRQGD